MLTVVIVIHLMLVVAMIGVVLLQKSEGGGLVSSTSGFMTGRGTANVLTRTTALLAVGFFVTSLALSWLAGLGHKPASIINPGGAPVTQGAPGAGGAAEPKREGRSRPIARRPAGGTEPGAKRAASAAVEIGTELMAQATSAGTLATTRSGADLRRA